MTVTRVGWHYAGTDQDRQNFPTASLVAGDMFVCVDTADEWNWNGSVWTRTSRDWSVGSKGGSVLSPTTDLNVVIWRAPYDCTVTAVKGYRVGGTGCSINARKNGSLKHLASDLSLTSAGTWMDGGTAQNTAYATGDTMELMIIGPTGGPTQIVVQVDIHRP